MITTTRVNTSVKHVNKIIILLYCLILILCITNTKQFTINDTYVCHTFFFNMNRCMIRRIKIKKDGFIQRFIWLVLSILITNNNIKNVSK